MANPLTLLLPIIPGTTPSSLGSSMAQYLPQIYTALGSIGTVHYARGVFLDTSSPNLLPTNPDSTGPFVFAMLTEYDGSFDAYIQDFVSQVGTVFDALLQIVVGGAAVTPVADNVAAFEAFLKQNDASQNPPNNGATYQAYTATVQQILASLPAAAEPSSNG